MFRKIVIWWSALVATLSSLSAATRTVETNTEDAIRNTPLLAAQQSLLLARSRIVGHRYSEAIPPLWITAEALAFVEELEIGRYEGFGAVAGDTRQQVLDYATSIETDNGNALSNINGWLTQIKQWCERRKPSCLTYGRAALE
jgi:hypothetical protein